MIRVMTEDDLDWLVKTAGQFSEEYMGKKINVTRTRHAMRHCITRGIALRSDAGAIVGIIMDDPFFYETHLVELGWYANDRSGLALLKQFHKIGKSIGVDSIRMTTLHSSPATADALLGRLGYTPLEKSWELRLGD